MRWDNLFEDLESQLDHELGSDDLDLRAEEERLRIRRMSLRERLICLHESFSGADYSVRIEIGAKAVKVSPNSLGRDWLAGTLIDDTIRNTQVVVPLWAVTSVILSRSHVHASLAGTHVDTGFELSARLGLTYVLRDLCRRRSALDLLLGQGLVHGTIDRVGRDHVDIAIHEAGTPRRESSVAEYRIVPLDQILMVRLALSPSAKSVTFAKSD